LVKLAQEGGETAAAPVETGGGSRFLGLGGATFESFGIRDYRWLWTSSVTSFTAMNMQMIARAWLVLRLADDSPLAVAWVTISFALPMVFVSALGGALADRISRRRLLVLCQAGNAVVALVIATLDLTGVINFWHIMASGVVSGSLMAFNMPSRQAIISEIVPEDKLMNGIALQSSGMNATRIVGPAAAGILILYLDTAGVFYLVAGLYASSVLTIAAINAGKKAQARSEKGLVSDIGKGFAYAAGNPTLLGLIIMAFIPVLFGMSYYVLLPAWAREALDVEAGALGLLMMTMGIGALIGSLAVAGLRGIQRRGQLLLASCIAWGIALALFSLTTSYALALPLLLFVGLASSVFMTLNFTLLQTYASAEMRGRIMSIAMMTFGVMPLSAVPFGVMAEHVGTPNALFLSGLLLTFFTIVFAIAYPHFRKIA
jgi:MFS family permease